MRILELSNLVAKRAIVARHSVYTLKTAQIKSRNTIFRGIVFRGFVCAVFNVNPSLWVLVGTLQRSRDHD